MSRLEDLAEQYEKEAAGINCSSAHLRLDELDDRLDTLSILLIVTIGIGFIAAVMAATK